MALTDGTLSITFKDSANKFVPAAEVTVTVPDDYTVTKRDTYYADITGPPTPSLAFTTVVRGITRNWAVPVEVTVTDVVALGAAVEELAAQSAATVRFAASEAEADAIPGQPLTIILAATVAAPTTAPTGLALTPSTTSISADWADLAGATGYEIQVGTTNPPTGTPQAAAGSAATVSGLLPMTAYFARVRATNAGGAGPWSAVVSTTTLAEADVAPAVPTGLSLTGGSGSLLLDWTDNTDEDLSGVTPYEYRIGLTNPPTGDPVTVGESTAVAGSLAAGDYYAQVRSRDAGGQTSAWSAVVGPATVTAAPANLPVVVQRGDNRITSGTALTTALPVAPVAGRDVIVMVGLDRATTQITPEAGWTKDAEIVGDGTFGGIAVYRRRVLPGEEAACQDFALTTSLACHITTQMYEVSNLTASAPVDQVSSGTFASTTTTTTLGPTGATTQEREIAFAARRVQQGSAGTVTPLTDGFTDDTKSIDATSRFQTGHKVLSATGPVQTTSTWTTAHPGAKLLLTYKAV